MNFITKIPIEKYKFPIDYSSKIISIGSCFAENMAEKFEYFKFQNTVNPFGIIFNAVSLERIIYRIVNQEFFTENDIFFHNEMWHCFEVHSSISNPDKDVFLTKLNLLIEQSNNQIKESTHIIITLGTSWVYKHLGKNHIVANCHKISHNQFTKELVSVETTKKSIENIINLIHSINKHIKFIFTISPVRHFKDGFIENNVSKAHLITAIYASISQFPASSYFPSFEIMMDELRDYRFYAADMLHPSQTAIDYIWIRFFENYVDAKEFSTMNQVCDIQKALQHKPFNVNFASHKQFLANLQKKIAIVQEINKHIQF